MLREEQVIPFRLCEALTSGLPKPLVLPKLDYSWIEM